jgi:5-methylcytosine-specific restriction endonuclease McrA
MGEQRRVQPAKAGAAEAAAERLTGKAVYRLVQQQGFRCALSGQELTPASASIDHKTPLCRGGSHTIDNAQVVEAEINRMKGTLTHDEFVRLCVLVARWSGGAA